MTNGIALSGSCSRRQFLLNEPVFLGFHDFEDGVWGLDYETKPAYWQLSYEWGRQIALHCKQEDLEISWKERKKIPRALGAALWGAMASGTFMQ
jgi:hypothetical protein